MEAPAWPDRAPGCAVSVPAEPAAIAARASKLASNIEATLNRSSLYGDPRGRGVILTPGEWETLRQAVELVAAAESKA